MSDRAPDRFQMRNQMNAFPDKVMIWVLCFQHCLKRKYENMIHWLFEQLSCIMIIEKVASKTAASDIKSRISAYLLAFGRRRSFISLIRPRTSFKIRRSTRASSNTTFILVFHLLSYGGLGRLLSLHRIRGHCLSSADDRKILSNHSPGFKMILVM